MAHDEFKFPVYATQGGGLARRVGNTYIFVTVPECPGLGIGDSVPEKWDVQPANAPAREIEATLYYGESLFDDEIYVLENALRQKR